MSARLFCAVFITLVASHNYAWNSMGHQLVAQIAYDNLTPATKQTLNAYNQSLTGLSDDHNFVAAATWLDRIRHNDVHWFDSLHYVNTPFSQDKTPLPPTDEMNALWGIKQALVVLSSPNAKLADKKLSLKILIHLVGDIHQPLHASTQVSKQLPRGDLGGNLFVLAKNPIGPNLHKYWDNGAGVLIGPSKRFQVRNKARQLEQKWSCQMPNAKKDPAQWLKESHELAISQVYKVTAHKVPNKKYQLKAQTLSQKQILNAGCRLALLLNGIVKSS